VKNGVLEKRYLKKRYLKNGLFEKRSSKKVFLKVALKNGILKTVF
jgi:hypothetical protein